MFLLLAQLTLGAQALPVFTLAEPTAGGESRAELRVTAPLAFGTAHLLGGRVQLHGMVNLEGLTMPGGQLATGAFGEGFNDRRHPHTWVHELVVSARDLVALPAGIRWSLTAGKGFAPYGTEDPMGRPPLIYPVNHHWSQILERAVLIAGISISDFTVEAGLFNGDEPESYTSWPLLHRFGDSHAFRFYGHLSRSLELQLSHASVKSPEHRNGSGLNHTMWNGSLAFERATRAGTVYALAEAAYVDEEKAFAYYSFLAETQLRFGGSRVWLRAERSDRPEEQRTDNFRSPRPHNENSNLGITRWTTITGGFAHRLRVGPAVRAEWIVEAAHSRVTTVTGIVFDPASFYGRNDLWMLSVGIRVAAGQPVHRMGRYGVASLQQPLHEQHH
jgi:hypothetical protein